MITDPRFAVRQGDITREPVDATEIKHFLESNKEVERVIVICYTHEVYEAYQAVQLT